jgi:hypothetical protein
MPTNTQGVLRLRPRINVTRGYAGNEPHSITRSEPLDTTITGLTSATSILSGQPIEFDGATGTWKHIDYDTNRTAAAGRTPESSVYFAFHDWNDTDVDSCDKLLGFSVLGKFEIETPWVDVTGLNVGDALGIKMQTQSDTTDTAILAKVAYSGDGSHTTTQQIGIVTGIRDLGVGGHTAGTYGTKYSGNERGGVAGTIPEDSTSDVYADGTGSNLIKIVKFVTQI